MFKSPEVRAAERECEAKVKRLRDSYTAAVYALGATLYKLLAGRAPFADEKYEAVINKLMALASETPPPLHELRNDIPRELSDFVARLLAKTPDERPATPREVAEALAPFAEGARLAELMRFVERADETETDGATDTFAHLSFCFTEIHRGAVPKAMVTDVVRQLREKHRISISIDEDAFDDAGIGTDTPITLHLEGIRLECLLSLIPISQENGDFLSMACVKLCPKIPRPNVATLASCKSAVARGMKQRCTLTPVTIDVTRTGSHHHVITLSQAARRT